MESHRKINLAGRFDISSNAKLLYAEIQQNGSFATLYYTTGELPQETGLRFDLGKRIILDSTGIAEFDKNLADHAAEIAAMLQNGFASMTESSYVSDIGLENIHEFSGRFWLPNSNHQVFGRMLYTPGEGIRLTLHGTLDQSRTHEFSWPEVPVIHAFMHNGTVVTLFKCFITKRSFGQKDSPTEMFANLAVLGALLTSRDCTFSSCQVRLSRFEEWVGGRRFEVEEAPDGKHRVLIQKGDYDSVTLEVPSERMSVMFCSSIAESYERTTATWQKIGSAMLTSRWELTIDEWMSRVSCFQDFMSICLGSTAVLTGLTLRIPNISGSSPLPDHGVELLVNQRLTKKRKADTSISHPIPFNAVVEKQDVIEKWFSLYRRSRKAMRMYFGIHNYESMPNDFRFVSLTNAIRFVSRSLHLQGAANEVGDEQFQKQMARMQRGLSLSPEQRKQLQSNLVDLLNPSQQRFFENLCPLLPLPLKAELEAKAPNLTDRIWATWIDLIEDQRLEGVKPFSGIELVHANNWLAILFLSVCLTEIGFASDEIVDVIQSTRDLEWTLNYHFR